MPAVSVVVPCFNGGRFLDALLASIAAQSFRDFEIVIVDDGSTELLTQQKLAALPPDIRVIHQKNRGLAAARNAGFSTAAADFVLPVDCDDTLEPTHLAETYAALKNAPRDVGFVYTHERNVGERTGVVKPYFNAFDQLFANRLSYCMLIRKEAWRAVGGYDESMRDGYEDWEFNIRLAKAGLRGIGVEKVLFVYRVSNEGMLMSRSSRMHGVLWRRMREKHPELYRVPALIRLWRKQPGRIGLLPAFALLAAARALPDAWFGALIHQIRRSRMTPTRTLVSAGIS
jgi:glycosyltransferase involved in cell wall biosynthesis